MDKNVKAEKAQQAFQEDTQGIDGRRGISVPGEATLQGRKAVCRTSLRCPGGLKGPISLVRLREVRGFGEQQPLG